MNNRWLIGSCAGITLVSLVAGITGMVFAINGFGDSRIESKISDLRDELPKESSLSFYGN